MNIKYPYNFNDTKQTAEAGNHEHIRNMIAQILFTNPGERVNRPDFGCGLLQLVFEPLSDELVATTRFLIQGSLIQWLGNLIEVKDVQVDNIDATLHISVTYLIIDSNKIHHTIFTTD